MAETKNLLTPDGRQLTLRVDGFDLSGRWHSSVLVRPERSAAGLSEGVELREFHVTTKGNFDLVARRELAAEKTEVLESQGGHFVIYKGQNQGCAYWQGAWHEIATFIPNPDAPTADALRYFEGLLFADTPEGLTLHSVSPINVVHALEVWNHIEGMGSIDIRRPDEAISFVPTWRGATVRTGEVWRTDSPDGTDPPLLIHVSDTTVMLVAPLTQQTVRKAIAFIEALDQIEWL